MTILTIILVLLLSFVVAIPVIGFINYELAREVVKRSTDRVVKQVIDERDTAKAIEEYNTKRNKLRAKAFPSVYNTDKELIPEPIKFESEYH